MLLIEKAYAKICGSYESSEKGHVKDAFQALAGGPGITFHMDDFKPDLKRGAGASCERFDVFWKLLNEANKKGWVTTCTTPPAPQEVLNLEEEA
jgi:hypothetical protein